jgi:hypothetical protein
MPTELSAHQHIGRLAAEAGQRVKALLTPLEPVCRYGERLGDDTAYFEVRPRAAEALPFTIAIAPGGINIDSTLLTMKELPIEQAEIAIGVVEAILAGRVRAVSLATAGGRIVSRRITVVDADGRPLLRQTKKKFHWGGRRGLVFSRRRAAPYATADDASR